MKIRSKKDKRRIQVAYEIKKLTGEPAKPWTHRQHRKNNPGKKPRYLFFQKQKIEKTKEKELIKEFEI